MRLAWLGAWIASTSWAAGAVAHGEAEPGRSDASAPPTRKAEGHPTDVPEGPAAQADDPSIDDELTVSIVGQRPSATSPSATTLTRRQLEAAPRRTAEDALRLVPGMTLVQHGSEGKGYQYFLRGFDAVHGAGFAVSVLGLPINEWSNVHAQGYVDLGFVIPETISAVHVTKGPFLLEQGAFAMAGSADYRLGLDPEDVGLRLGVTTGTTGRLRAVATYARPESDGQDFIALEGTSDAGFGQNRAIQHGSVLGLTRIAESSRFGQLSVLTAAHAARFELPGSLGDEDVTSGALGFYDSYDETQHGKSERGLLGLIHEWQGERGRVRTTLHGSYRRLELLENYTGFLLDPLEGDRRQQIQRTTQLGMTVRGDWDPSPALGVTAGLGASVEALSQEQAHLGQDLQRLETNRRLSGSQSAAHALVGVHVHPWRSVVVHAGVRLDLAQVDAWDAVAEESTLPDLMVHFGPRITASYRPLDSLELSLAYGRGFRPPEIQALAVGAPLPPGNTNDDSPARMVSIDSAEAGLRFQASRYFGMRLSGFGSVVEHEVVFDHISGQNLELSGTRRLGLEAGVSSNPLPFLTLAADVTWVDARFLESGDPVPFAPWLVAGLHAVLTHDSGWRGGLRLLGLAPRALPYAAIGSPLVTLDATAGYGAQKWHLDLELENILDLALREGESMFASDFPPGPPSALPARHFSAAAPRNARLTLTVLF